MSRLARFQSNMAESLGQGIQSPASPPPTAAIANDRMAGISRAKDVAVIPLDKMTPDPDQPRKEFEQSALVMLSASLLSHGQLQPIRVRWSEDLKMYVIVSGERRYRAAKLAGLASLSATIAVEKSADETLEEQLVENALRQDLSPMEQARAYRRLIDAKGYTHAELAKRLSISQPSVTRSLAMLELPCTVQDRVESGELPSSIAYEVSKAPEPEREALAKEATEKKLSREQVVELRTNKTTRAFRAGECTVKVTGPADADIEAALKEALRQHRKGRDAA